MDYIFIDESGELGKQTKYFVFGAIIVNNPKKLDKLIKRVRKKYKKQLGKAPEIKGNKIDNYIIKKILKKINTIDCEIVAIIFDKKNIYKIQNKTDFNVLYNTIASELAKRISITNPTSIIIDKYKNKEDEIDNFNKTFKSNLNNFKNYPIIIKHGNSINYNGLQIVDLISWSIFQSVEHKNFEFINLIENKTVKKVFEE